MSESIGVGELRQYASTYLARVREGESIVITDRGRPIARIVPLGEGESDWQAAWIAQGRMRPATAAAAGWLDVEPVPLVDAAGTSVLAVLEDMRRDPGEPSALDP
jgi:prevent-host-death family protein